ncbi:UNVERIFIED_CONTAM: hypothetical protein RMT77_001868 [Armadillidium vulgare]
MNLKILNIFVLLILQIILFCAISNSLNVNDACLFKEEGFSLSFVTTPYIHFFIPHNWANDEDNLNHLKIKLFNTNLVLRHPLSSKKESNEINLPLNELNIGWNKIYIRKRRNKVQVVTDNSGSRKVVQNFTLSEDFDSDADPQATLVTGLYSLGKCLNARRRIYYNIRAKSSFRLPFILYKKANKFVAFSKTNSFNFNVICSGKRQKICKNGKNSVDSFTIRKECEDGSVSFFSPNIVNDVYVSSKAFDPEDNMNYNYTVFVDLVLENIGNDDFFVEMEVINPSSAPISGLKVKEGTTLSPLTIYETEVKKDNKVTTLSPGIIYETEVKKVCGFNDKKSNVNRIVGGKAADPKDWPWMAALLKIEDLSFFCGGVLITDRYVLTAAHCFQEFPFYEAKVRLGEYDFGTPNENNVSDFNIERFFYPNYNLVTGDNDIALLKLERPTLFGDFISPVCLSPRFGTFENRLGIVIGWGTQQHGGSHSNILREVMIKILKRNECEAAFLGNNPITTNMFCAGLGGRDSCQGDSGGPFLIQEPDSRWYVVGIVSRGIGCGQLNQPGVYTKVNNYLDWIENHIKF